MSESFSLKDQLFNTESVSLLASYFANAHPHFPEEMFIEKVVSGFKERELKERIEWITQVLSEVLPDDYHEASNLILRALPEPLNPELSDNDFGDFIIAPLSLYIARNGCTKEHLHHSLTCIREITKRFSAEDAIRYFINTFPKETLRELGTWVKDENYHVRRLVSEGTRPKLPWSQKIVYTHHDTLPLLDSLYTDTKRYITRSVANHLNDISKVDANTVVRTLKKWRKNSSPEIEFITRHALRTLVKQGHPEALALLGYEQSASVEVIDFSVVNKKVQIGDSLEFHVELVSTLTQKLVIDYAIHFTTKSGKPSRKVFKLKRGMYKEGGLIELTKKHSFKPMTTRALYPGIHTIELMVNGVSTQTIDFSVV